MGAPSFFTWIFTKELQEMTTKLSFSYNFFLKVWLYNTVNFYEPHRIVKELSCISNELTFMQVYQSITSFDL